MLLSIYKNLLSLCLATFLTTLVFSHNLIFFFISWVGVNVTLYGSLLFSSNKTRLVTESVSKYFVTGVIVTVSFLFSTLLYLVVFGTYSTESISFIVLKGTNCNCITPSDSYIPTPVEILFYVSSISLFLFKLGAFPFHYYLPDIYNILDKKTNMLIYTVVVKVGIFYALLSFISHFWFLSDLFSSLLLVSSIGSLVISAITALGEQNIRRFLSHSYLNSLGYVLLAVSSGLSFGFGSITFFSAELYFVSYLLSWTIIYLVMFSDFSGAMSTDRFNFFSDLNSLAESNRKNITYTLTTFGLVISLASLLGLPPTLGFYAKFVLYLSLSGSCLSTATLFFVLAISPIMAMSYIRLLSTLLLPTPTNDSRFRRNMSMSSTIQYNIALESNSTISYNIIFIFALLVSLVFFAPIPYICVMFI